MAVALTPAQIADNARCYCLPDFEKAVLYLLYRITSTGIASSMADTVSDPTIKSAATALDANTERVGFHIQNMSATDVLYVKRGAGCTAVAGNYEFVLQPGEAQDDGTGGAYVDYRYSGIVTIAGTDARYICTEMT